MIGTLRWLVEIDRVDLSHSVSIMSSFMASPKIGHLHEVLHIFGFLRSKSDSTLVLDGRGPILKTNLSSSVADWKDFYPDACEAIPPNAPTPRCLPISTLLLTLGWKFSESTTTYRTYHLHTECPCHMGIEEAKDD